MISSEINKGIGWNEFHAIMARLDQLEDKMDRILNEINNENKPKDLPLSMFFSTFCVLKAWDERHPSARTNKSSLNQFFKFLRGQYPDVENLRELTPIMVSEYVKHLKDSFFSKKRNRWEKLSDRTVNAHIKKLRHALEVIDSRGTQKLREHLITIKRPKTKKEIYTPTDEEHRSKFGKKK